MCAEKLFVSENIVLEEEVLNGGIVVGANGKIAAVLRRDQIDETKNYEIIDVGELYVMPGIVDSHVHINEPGRTEWEGFESATKAAAAGGVTTIVDMPLNSIPPTTTVENLKVKLEAAEGKLLIDVGFWGGVVPGNQEELVPLVEAGVIGFKCFLCPSGVDEFVSVTSADVEIAMEKLESTNSVFAFHAEVEPDVATLIEGGDPVKYETFLRTRPVSMEIDAISEVIRSAKKYPNLRVHIVHLSAAEALPLIAEAKKSGMRLTVETCHHYLNMCSEDVEDGRTEFKCCPPIRDSANRDLLWRALKDGTIDMVVSDHSPSTPDLKLLSPKAKYPGDFLRAWGGISSLQFGLPLFYTKALKYGFSIFDMSRLMSRATAKLAGLGAVKGCIKAEFDADFVVWDPNGVTIVEASSIYHKNKATPYMGRELQGLVRKTVLRGEIVYDSGKFSENKGKLLVNRSML